MRESEDRYRRIVETTDEGIWTIDASTSTTFVNPKMARMLGYTIEEMQGRPLRDFMDDEGWAFAQAQLARRAQGIADLHEFRFRRKDGSELWALLTANAIQDASGQYVGALAMVTDVTERHRAEESLRESEARFRSLFENSPISLWEEDLSRVKQRVDELKASGIDDFAQYLELHPEEVAHLLSLVNVLDVNDAAVRTYEAKSKAELLAGLGHVLTQESFVVLRAELVALARGDTVFESEATDQTFTGARHHVLIRTLVAPGSEKTWSRVYVSIVDLTAQKQAEAKRLLLEEQLRQSQKMDAIGQVAGGVAHDFNNLLTVIQGNTSILQSSSFSPEQRDEALAQIAQATERGASLTKQLLTFSRQQAWQPQKLDLNQAVQGLAKMLERLLGGNIRLEVQLCQHPLYARADAAMLDQVLMNLVVNARDAMPEGGRLMIHTSALALTDEDLVRFRDARPGPHVCLSVADTGCGIAEHNLERIFEPFFSTKPPDKGTGLGLSTVFGIVKQHGGALSVVSELGRGTRIEVALPATEGPSASPERTATKPRGGSESVLLVEDEKPVRQLLQRLLESGGYRVQAACSGVEALELWQREREAFDVVVTDIVMPGGLSGTELAEKLRETRPATKVIFISGYSGELSTSGNALHEGVNFLQKPFSAERLLRCVRAQLDEHD